MRYPRLIDIVAVLPALSRLRSPTDNVLHADREPQNWLTYSGGYSSQRYSLLTRSTGTTSRDLQLKWVHPGSAGLGGTGRWPQQQDREHAPGCERDHVYRHWESDEMAQSMRSREDLLDLQATTVGPSQMSSLNWYVKGVAVSGGTACSGRPRWTSDRHRCKNGKLSGIRYRWIGGGLPTQCRSIDRQRQGHVGPATNEDGANCWVAAYDVKTGKELWRFWTSPTPPANHGPKPGETIPISTEGAHLDHGFL